LAVKQLPYQGCRNPPVQRVSAFSLHPQRSRCLPASDDSLTPPMQQRGPHNRLRYQWQTTAAIHIPSPPPIRGRQLFLEFLFFGSWTLITSFLPKLANIVVPLTCISLSIFRLGCGSRRPVSSFCFFFALPLRYISEERKKHKTKKHETEHDDIVVASSEWASTTERGQWPSTLHQPEPCPPAPCRRPTHPQHPHLSASLQGRPDLPKQLRFTRQLTLRGIPSPTLKRPSSPGPSREMLDSATLPVAEHQEQCQ